MRNIDLRAAGIGVTVAGMVLWIIAVAVDAPTMAIILPVAIVILGALLMLRAE